MKKVVFNKDNLKEDEIEIRREKVRALIIDDQGIVTLCKYHDVYLLPGGKIEDSETKMEALNRELKEELGLEFLKEEITPLLRVVTMARNYPNRNKETTNNRCCQTDYYLIHSNQKFNPKERHLTTSEKSNRFQIEYVPLSRVLEVIENHGHYNSRNDYFFRELLEVLKVYSHEEGLPLDTSLREGLIDLHIHTTASDGENTANEIIEMAIQKKVQAISITDHDNILGYDQLVYDKNKIQVIPGIELSAYIPKGRLHILGYGFRLDDPIFKKRLQQLHENSIENILIFVDLLRNDYGIVFPEEEIQALIQTSSNVGRPDLAKLMMKYGMVQSVQEAFDQYLIEANQKLVNDLKIPTYIECLEILKQAGGIPVLAHPHSLLLDFPELSDKIREMKEAGLQGLEVYHSNTSKDLSEKLVDLAVQENLYMTGGSDYHGMISKPDIQLFSGKKQNMKVKRLNLVNELSNL